jgi:sortase A
LLRRSTTRSRPPRTRPKPRWTSRRAIRTTPPVGEPILNYDRPEELAEINVVAEPALPGEVISESPGSDPGTNAPLEIQQLDPDQFADQQPLSQPVDQSVESDADALGTDEVNDGIADAFSEGWFGDPFANSHIGIWGVALSVISVGAYSISHKLRRDWAGALMGLLPFMVALYFCFQNVNRLLPPNL